MVKLSLLTCIVLFLLDVHGQDLVPAKMDGKWGFVDNTKTWVIKPKFEETRKFSEGFAAASKKGKWGFINSAGKWTAKPKFDGVGDFSESLAAAKVGDYWGYINPLGELKINIAFEKAYPFNGDEAQVVLPNMLPRQRIVINNTGKQIAPPHIIRKEVAPNVYHIISQKANKDSVFCYINGEGELLTDWYLTNFSWGETGQKVAVFADRENDQLPVKVLENDAEKYLYTFIDDAGKPISDWYEEVMPFKDGVAPAKKNHRFGFINDKYETIVDYQYLEIRVLDETRYVGQTIRDGFVLLNLKGEIIGKEYHGFDLYNDEHIVAYSMVDFMGRKTYRKALFTHECKQVSGWYTEIYPQNNHYHRVLDEMVRYTPEGEVTFVEVYNYIVDSTGDVLSTWRPTSEMTWSTDKGRKYKDSVYQFMHQPDVNYFIEETFFNDVFYAELEEEGNAFHFKGGDFHDGMAMISEKKSNKIIEKEVNGIKFNMPDVKYGFIDWNGDQRIACKYDYISGFSDGKAIFKQNGKFGAISYKGKVVLPAKFELLGNFGSGMAPFYADSAWGYIYTSGKVALKPIYDEALPHRYGYAAVKVDKKWGLIDTQGNTVLKFKYRRPPLAVSNRKVKVLIDGVGYEEIDLE